MDSITKVSIWYYVSDLVRKPHRAEKHEVVLDKDLYIDCDNDISRIDPENLPESDERKENDVETPESVSGESIIQGTCLNLSCS